MRDDSSCFRTCGGGTLSALLFRFRGTCARLPAGGSAQGVPRVPVTQELFSCKMQRACRICVFPPRLQELSFSSLGCDPIWAGQLFNEFRIKPIQAIQSFVFACLRARLSNIRQRYQWLLGPVTMLLGK